MVGRNKGKSIYAVVLLLVLLYMIPIIFMIFLSLKPVGISMGSDMIADSRFTVKNYVDVFTSGLYGKYIVNGLIVAVCASILSVTIGFFAAYALSRFKFPFKEKFFMGMIAIKAVPPVLMSIAFFHFAVKSHLYNTLWVLILLDTVFNVPLAVMMLRNFIDAVPKELDEASKIDGCRQFTYLGKVMFPLTLAGIVSVLVQCFLLSWNEYMYAVLFINDDKLKMPTVAIYDFIGQWSTNYIGIVTFAVLLSLPVVIAFLLVQKYYVKGMLAGSDK